MDSEFSVNLIGGGQIVELFSVLGQNTLYTFMYHLLVRDILLKYFPNMITYNFIIKLILFIMMVVIPVVLVIVVKNVKNLYWNRFEAIGIKEV